MAPARAQLGSKAKADRVSKSRKAGARRSFATAVVDQRVSLTIALNHLTLPRFVQPIVHLACRLSRVQDVLSFPVM